MQLLPVLPQTYHLHGNSDEFARAGKMAYWGWCLLSEVWELLLSRGLVRTTENAHILLDTRRMHLENKGKMRKELWVMAFDREQNQFEFVKVKVDNLTKLCNDFKPEDLYIPCGWAQDVIRWQSQVVRAAYAVQITDDRSLIRAIFGT